MTAEEYDRINASIDAQMRPLLTRLTSVGQRLESSRWRYPIAGAPYRLDRGDPALESEYAEISAALDALRDQRPVHPECGWAVAEVEKVLRAEPADPRIVRMLAELLEDGAL